MSYTPQRKPKTQLRLTIDVLENAMDEVSEIYDNMGAGNEDLVDYTQNELENLIEKILNKKWTDVIGQRI